MFFAFSVLRMLTIIAMLYKAACIPEIDEYRRGQGAHLFDCLNARSCCQDHQYPAFAERNAIPRKRVAELEPDTINVVDGCFGRPAGLYEGAQRAEHRCCDGVHRVPRAANGSLLLGNPKRQGMAAWGEEHDRLAKTRWQAIVGNLEPTRGAVVGPTSIQNGHNVVVGWWRQDRCSARFYMVCPYGWELDGESRRVYYQVLDCMNLFCKPPKHFRDTETGIDVRRRQSDCVDSSVARDSGTYVQAYLVPLSVMIPEYNAILSLTSIPDPRQTTSVAGVSGSYVQLSAAQEDTMYRACVDNAESEVVLNTMLVNRQ